MPHNTPPPERDSDRGRMPDDGGRAVSYVSLPDHTRRFLENLRDDDVERLDSLTTLLREKGFDKIETGVQMAQDAVLLGKWSKRLLLAIVAVFGSAASLFGAWQTFAGYFRQPGGHP